MRNNVPIVAIAGLCGVLMLPPARADTANGGIPSARLSAQAPQFAQASPSTSSGADKASDRCGPPHEFESRPIAANMDRAKANFALGLLGSLPSKTPNVSASPFGIAAVLSTLDLGADPAMKEAIVSTLRVGGPGKMEALRREARLINLSSARDPSRFASFNGVFADHRLSLKPGVADLAKADGDVELQSVDFASQKGIDGVNELLAKKTGGRIKSILEPGSAPLLVAANAFVFKDCWKVPFDKSQTANKSFTRGDGSKVEVPTMSLVSDSIGYRSNGRFAAVQLPYKDEDFVLTLVTTKERPAKVAGFRGAAPLMAGIGFADAKVTLSLPKFGGAADNDLLEVLSSMGLKAGLESSNQFPGFAEGLVLSRVRQKTWLSVDETGTEAAAVTVAETTRSVDAPKSVTMNFDKPFVYALRHRPTGTILMSGYVGDPGAQDGTKKD